MEADTVDIEISPAISGIDLLPLVDVDLTLPPPADEAALEQLEVDPLPMSLESAPLDEARLGCGLGMDMLASRPPSYGPESPPTAKGASYTPLSQIGQITKDALFGSPPSRDASLATIAITELDEREEEAAALEDAHAELGDLLEAECQWPPRTRSPPPPEFDAAFLRKHARWQESLRSALSKADGYTRSLVGAAAGNSPCGTMVVISRISPRQIAALHQPVRELVQRLLDTTRAHAALDEASLDLSCGSARSTPSASSLDGTTVPPIS